MTEDDAKTKLIESEFEIKAALNERDEHEQLQAAKELVKDLNAGFSSAVKYEKAKIEFLLEQIESRRRMAEGLE